MMEEERVRIEFVDRAIPRLAFSNLRVGSQHYYGEIYARREDIPTEGEGRTFIVLPDMASPEHLLRVATYFMPELEEYLRSNPEPGTDIDDIEGLREEIDSDTGYYRSPYHGIPGYEEAPKIKLGWSYKE